MTTLAKKVAATKKASPDLAQRLLETGSIKRTKNNPATGAVLVVNASKVGPEARFSGARRIPGAELVVNAPKVGPVKRSVKAFADPFSFADIYSAQPSDRIKLIRNGVPANYVVYISKSMGITRENLFNALGLPRSTIERKVTNNQALPPEQGERVIGMAKLVGQVQVMVEQSGNSIGFDAAEWLAHWMDAPLPALGGDTPASYMDTIEGQELISGLIAKMQSGAYA